MDEKNIAILIKVASTEFDKHANRFLSKYGLTTSQYKIIKYILDSPYGSVRQIDLENFFYMTNPTVTGIVQNLVKKGYIEKIPNPEDGRSKVLIPSKKLLEMKSEILGDGKKMEENFTECFNESEKAELKKLLKKLLADKLEK